MKEFEEKEGGKGLPTRPQCARKNGDPSLETFVEKKKTRTGEKEKKGGKEVELTHEIPTQIHREGKKGLCIYLTVPIGEERSRKKEKLVGKRRERGKLALSFLNERAKGERGKGALFWDRIYHARPGKKN